MSETYVIHWQSQRLIGQHLIIGDEAACVRDVLGGDPAPANLITKIERYDADEHTAEVVTEDIARAVSRAGASEVDGITSAVRDFIHDYAGPAWARGLRVIDRTFAEA